MKHSSITSFLAIIISVNLSALSPGKAAGDYITLWQIGEADNDNSEFSLAPDKFHSYERPGIHVVGLTDPAKSWPYILTGDLDLWTPNEPQTFEILFYLEKVKPGRDCRLRLDFLDTHSFQPPKIRVKINNQVFEHQTPRGNNDWLMGAAGNSGREHIVEIQFSGTILREGSNRIEITGTNGSYALWDAVVLEVQEGIEGGKPEPGTFIRSVTEKQVLLKNGDNPLKPLELEIVHVGAATEATLEISGANPVKTELIPGVQIMQALIPEIQEPKEVLITLNSGGEILAKTSSLIHPVRDWEVHLIHQTHLDIGFTHTQEDVLKMQTSYLYQALDLIEKTKDYPEEARFKWHPEGMWAIDEFLKTAPEEKKQQFMNAIHDQSIHLDAFYVHLLTGLATGEELFELIQPAKDFEKEYGVPVKTAIGSDIPGYSWGLVTALAQQGVEFLNTAPNNNHRLGHLYKLADKPFFWLSPNGQDKVFTWMASHAYIYFWWDMNTLNRVPRFLDHLEKSEFPYEIAMLRYEIGGDNGYPDPSLPDKVKSWNEKYASPKIILSTNTRLYNSFLSRYEKEIPVASGDLTPYWEDGATSTAEDLALSRHAGERLLQLHALHAITQPGSEYKEEFKLAWNKIVMYDEHTWGAHSSISDPFGPFTVSQEKYKSRFALDADSIIRKLEGDLLRDFHQAGSGIIDVYNTSSWERSDIVFLSADQSTMGDRVLDDRGRQVPSQRMSAGELAFRAVNVPAFGLRRYRVENGQAMEGDEIEINENGISNNKLRLTLDPESGSIESIVIKESGRELVPPAGYKLNEFVYIRGRETGKGISGIVSPVSIVVEDAGPLIGTLRIESGAPGCNKLTRRVRLIAGDPGIEIKNTVDKLQVLEPEQMYFAFPLNIPGGQARIDIPWGVMRPETDQMPGANRNYYPVQRWMDVSNGGFGLTWVTPDAPMIKLDPLKIVGKGRGEGQFVSELGKAGVQKWWNESVSPGQTFFSWVMSNHWETNYKAYQEGEITFRYVMIPHDNGYNGYEAEKSGREICQPLIPLEANPGSPTDDPGFSLNSRQIIATSLRPVGDKGDLMLRLYNTESTAGLAEITGRNKEISIRYSDSSGTPIKPAGSTIELPGYGVTTLRIGNLAPGI